MELLVLEEQLKMGEMVFCHRFMTIFKKQVNPPALLVMFFKN